MGEESVVLKDQTKPAFLWREFGDVLTFKQNASAVRILQSGNEPQGRGFATATRAEKGKELAF